MNILDIDLVNEPLDIDSFSYLEDKDYPFCMIGFQLKNLYDQKRLIFNKDYSPRDVIHLVPNDAVLPKFFRGIKVDLKKEYIPLIKQLELFGMQTAKGLTPEVYKDILSKYNLSCENCYAYLNKGIYPIDGEMLEKISTNNFTLENLYENGLDKTTPLFQSMGYFVIYILSNKNVYETSTKNYLHAIVKTYNSL